MKQTLFDKYFIFGISSTIPSLIFIGCLIIAFFIHIKRFDLKHRLAFFAFSFIPIIAGFTVFSYELSNAIEEAASRAAIYDIKVASLEFPVYFNILILASLETGILLFIAGLLLMGETSSNSTKAIKIVEATV